MENNRIKESISAVNQSLGIDLEVIVNDAQLESQKKFKLTYEKVLTALLIKWMRNDTKGELGLPPDFSVKDFVAAQLGSLPTTGEEIATSGTMQAIPNLLLMPELVEKVKRAKGKEVETIVNTLFDMTTTILQNDRFDVMDIANISVKFGIFAVSLIGGAAAIVTLASLSATTSGAIVLAAVAGATAAGATIIFSFLAFIYSLFTCGILFDRSFFGIVLNDTNRDLSIPDWKNESNAKSRYSGIYCRHGWLSGLMIDDYNGGQAAVVGKRGEVQDQHYCYCGLYLLEKNFGATGSEGFFRFEINSVKFDMNATCPMSYDNRLYTSFDHTNESLYKANSNVANEWKDKKKKSKDEALYGKVSAKGVGAIYSLNKLTGSPAYGITIVEES